MLSSLACCGTDVLGANWPCQSKVPVSAGHPAGLVKLWLDRLDHPQRVRRSDFNLLAVWHHVIGPLAM